jgi:ATP-dependent Clp protease ATP-binding subunit ClpA
MTAGRFGHACLDTEHLLLGLTLLEQAGGPRVLRELDLDATRIQVEVASRVSRGLTSPSGDALPFTPAARRVIAFALEEVHTLRRNHIGPVELLLGLLREEQGLAARVLRAQGLSLDRVRAIVDGGRRPYQETVPIGLWTPATAALASPPLGIPVDRFTARMECVWRSALEAARKAHESRLTTEHLLLGLIGMKKGVAAHLLRALGIVAPIMLWDRMNGLEKREPGSPGLGRIHVGPGVRVVLAFAEEEAARSRRDLIGTGHLLLGLIHEEEGLAGRALRETGIALEPARIALDALFRRIDDDPIWDLIG